jgi:hypothetical protein
MSEQTKFEEWAKVELMGHQMVIGKVTEVALAGGAFLRVDVPARGDDVAFTRFYNPSAVYCIHPMDEAVAKAMLDRFAVNPVVHRFQLPALEAKVATGDDNIERCEGCSAPMADCVCND